jgi:hypothetical protein
VPCRKEVIRQTETDGKTKSTERGFSRVREKEILGRKEIISPNKGKSRTFAMVVEIEEKSDHLFSILSMTDLRQ